MTENVAKITRDARTTGKLPQSALLRDRRPRGLEHCDSGRRDLIYHGLNNNRRHSNAFQIEYVGSTR